MSWHGGKGDKPRSVNKEVFDKNYESIFRKKYNLFLDDQRSPSQAFLWSESSIGNTLLEKTRTLAFQWEVVRSFDELQAKIEEKGLPEKVSLDNDLTDAHVQYRIGYPEASPDNFEDNGISCLRFLLSKGMPKDSIFIHTNNDSAARIMFNLINN